MIKTQSTLRSFLATLCMLVVSTSALATEPFAAVKAIVGRLASGYSGEVGETITSAGEAAMAKFTFEQLAGSGETATVGPNAAGDGILIKATTTSAASFALGQYIRDTQKGHISWCGNRIPAEWPIPESEKTYAPSQPVRLAYNYCTLSYTMAFWGKKQWREEIDRLALQGMNVALILNGLPKVWQATLQTVKNSSGNCVYSDEQIRGFVADEAAMAWWHMGNLEGLGGPMSQARIDADAELGRFIYQNMYVVGIEPMLQSFVGLVPRCSMTVLGAAVPKDGSLASYSADSNFSVLDQGTWCKVYPRPPVLNPISKAFDDFSDAWYAALKEIYAITSTTTTKYLCGDLFHEGGNTGSLTAQNLADVAAKIQRTQQAQFGKDAIWMLQAWQLSDGQMKILNGLDTDHAIVESLDKNMGASGPLNFSWTSNGKRVPWIWSEVFNFGGNTGMNGADARIRKVNQVDTDNRPSFKGYALLSEGYETNAMLYDMMLTQMHKPLGEYMDTDEKAEAFMEAFRVRRYGYTDANLKSAYTTLLKTAWHQFNTSAEEGCVENILCALPNTNKGATSLATTPVSQWAPKTGTQYDPTALYDVAASFLAAAQAHPALWDEETFVFDVQELFLQLLGDRGRQLVMDLATSQSARDQFRRLLSLAERLTASGSRWRLDWHEARTTGTAGDAGKVGYRRMVTSWTGNYDTAGTSQLREYAHRGYAGLFKDYYAKRWEWYFKNVEGEITAAQYLQNLKDLDASFPSATLTYTEAEDLATVAAEVLATVDSAYKVESGETKTPETVALIANDVVLDNGTLNLAFANGTDATIGALRVRAGGGTIVLATGIADTPSSLKIEVAQIADGAELVFKGAADSLDGASSVCKVNFPKSLSGKVYYICTNSESEKYNEKQTLTIGSDGWAKPALGALTYSPYLTETATKTGWKNVTLDELATYEFTAKMNGSWTELKDFEARACHIVRNGDTLTFDLQAKDSASDQGSDRYYIKSMPVTLTIDSDGVVCIKAAKCGSKLDGSFGAQISGTTAVATSATGSGYGIHDLLATPAVAGADTIGANYDAIGPALEVATDKKVTIYGYAEWPSTTQKNISEHTITIGENGTLVLKGNDLLNYNGNCTLNIYGALDIGSDTHQTIGANNTFNLYAGAKITGTGDSECGLSLLGASTINVLSNGENTDVTIEPVCMVRNAITIDVAEGTKVSLESNLIKPTWNESGTRKITKTGAGELVFNGIIGDASITFDAKAGKVTKNLSPLTSFTVTESGATVNVVSTDPDDYEVIVSGTAPTKTYTSTKIVWLVLVTDPGIDTWSGAGKKFRTYEEALAYAQELQAANPGELVNMWAVEENRNILSENLPDGVTIFSSPSGMILQGWNTPEEESIDNFDAVKAIVGRLAGGYNGAAEAGVDTAKADAAMAKFVFVKDAGIAAGAAKVGPGDGDTIKITASDLGGASYGLGMYIKETQKGHISWCGNRIPDTWPVPAAEKTYTPAVPVRLAYNYCTLSYTMAFWSKKEWREEIDRLALEGLNVALVLNGLPAVWRETLRSVKDSSGNQVFSDEQIRAFIADEAAMAWWHMGNLEGLGGPMSDDRIDADAELAKWMYAEMMKLGVQPMLQSFVGLMPYIAYNPGLLANGVPKDPAVKAQYPTYGSDPALAWKYLGLWVSAFPRPPILMPTTAAFDDLSDAWYAALANVYDSAHAGSTKFLCGDLFHECASSGLSKDVLKAAGKKVQDTQKKYFGEDVTWLLQAWQINESQRFVIQGLDKDHILVEVLDKNMGNNGGLGSDVRDGDGNIAPFIWTEVANFGGNTGMRGFDTRVRKLNNINTSQVSVFSGYGFLSEGFETNPIMYDMMLEQMAKTPNDASTYLDTDQKMEDYMEAYRLRRYGYTDSDLRSAYSTMIGTVWHQKATSAQEGCVENILCALPGYGLANASVSSWGPKTGTEYDPALLFPAADHYLAAVATKPELLDLETFRYDFIELFLQLLGDRARQINSECATSQKQRDLFRKLLDLAERLTACQGRWRLDWHEDRTKDTAGAAGKMAYRRMVTNWTGNYQTSRTSGLREYAHRAYSGLIKGYYAKRWEWYFQQTEGKLTSAQYEANLKALDAEIQTATIEYTPEGDLLAIANEILETLNPPALTRSITTPSATWNKTDTVWKNAKGQTVAWEDGLDVNLGGVCTVTATESVTTGSFTLQASDVADPAIYTGWLPVGEANAVKLFENIGGPDFAGFIATMDGAWVPNSQAKAYCVTYDPVTDSTSAQFQVVDGGFLKAVEVKFFRKSDNSVWGYTVGMGNINGGSYGQKVSVGTSNVAQAADQNGYGVYGIKTLKQSELTLEGPITIGGALTVADGKLTITSGDQLAKVSDVTIGNGTLIFSAGTTATIPTLSLIDAEAKIELKGTTDITINALTTVAGAKLTIVGSGEMIPEGAIKLVTPAGKVIKPAAGLIYYTDGVDTYEMTIDATGALKAAPRPMDDTGWISATAKKTSLNGVTLDDLATYEYTGTMSGGWINESVRGAAARGYQIEKSADAVTVYMQIVDTGVTKSLKVTLTIGDDGYVYVKGSDGGYVSGNHLGEVINKTNDFVPTSDTANGYGVKTFVATPGCAQIATTKSNYATIDAAIAAANGMEIVLVADATINTATKASTVITVPKGLTLTSYDKLSWEQPVRTLNVYGTVDFGASAHSIGQQSKYRQQLNLYAGAQVICSNAEGLSMFGTEAMTINAKAYPEGGDTITIDSVIQVRYNTTLAVEEGVTVVLNGNIRPRTNTGMSGGHATFTKSGKGKLVWNGALQTGVSTITVAAADGDFEYTLGKGEEITITENGGTVKVVSADKDYKCVKTGDTAAKTYTSTKIIWLVFVTDPGVTTWSGSGTKYETLEEGFAAIRKLRAENPGEFVQIWAVEENMEALTAVLPEGVTINSSPSGMYLEGWDKRYFVPGTVINGHYEWDSSYRAALAKGGEGTEEIKSGDTITFASTVDKLIYIQGSVKCTDIEIVDNSTVTFGYGTAVLPDNWTVTVQAGSTLNLGRWDNASNKGPTKLGDNLTFNGEGTVTFTATATEPTCGSITGTATITIPSGCTLTATGMIDNPIAGAGTLKISGDQVLKFAAGSTVTVAPTTESYSYYAIESVIANADGTTTKVYKKIELAEPNAFGKSWTNLFLGPETVGDDASWNTAANWAQINPKSIVRKTDGKAPYISGGVYTSSLLDGEVMSNIPVDANGYKQVNLTGTMDGWTIMVGVINGVSVTIDSLSKIQAGSEEVDQSLYVDATSKITINGGTDSDKKKGHTLNLRVSADEGVTFAEAFSDNAHFNYYLNGEGSVKWAGSITDGNHALKTADFAIGTGAYTQFKTKKLVSFGSTTKDFSVDGLTVTITDDAEATATMVESLAADSVAGSYKIRSETDGIYLDYVAKSETRPLLVWNTANKDWKAATEATIEGTSFTKVPTADDTVVFTETFTTLGSSVLYIWPDKTTKNALTACRKMIVRDGVTLHLGFAESTCNIPNDFTITLEGSAKLVLSRWNSAGTGTCALGSNVTINGGSVEIDTTRATALTVGDLYGTTTLTIPANYTVTAEGDVGVTLSGSGTLVAANLGTIEAVGWTGSVDATQVVTRGINSMAGVITVDNGDGTKTIYIRECANELHMTAGGKLSEGTYKNPFDNTITWAQLNAMTIKPLIVLEGSHNHYFGDTSDYDFAVREGDVYCMITGGSYAFGDSYVTVEGGTLHLITSETLNPNHTSSSWNPNSLKFANTTITTTGDGKVVFKGADANSKIEVEANATLTLLGNLNNITIEKVKFDASTGSLQVEHTAEGVGSITLVGANTLKDIKLCQYSEVKVPSTASVANETTWTANDTGWICVSKVEGDVTRHWERPDSDDSVTASLNAETLLSKVPEGTPASAIAVTFVKDDWTTYDLKANGYATVSVTEDGAVTIEATDKAAPVTDSMAMETADEGGEVVGFVIDAPVPGLVYTVLESDNPTSGFAVPAGAEKLQAQNSLPIQVKSAPTDKKVRYYRINVDVK